MEYLKQRLNEVRIILQILQHYKCLMKVWMYLRKGVF